MRIFSTSKPSVFLEVHFIIDDKLVLVMIIKMQFKKKGQKFLSLKIKSTKNHTKTQKKKTEKKYCKMHDFSQEKILFDQQFSIETYNRTILLLLKNRDIKYNFRNIAKQQILRIFFPKFCQVIENMKTRKE